ncbi:hypothetical protein Hanom_Chr05g00471671 [Helianthus anomalus]
MECDEKLQNEDHAPELDSKKSKMNGQPEVIPVEDVRPESIPVEVVRSVRGEGPQEVQGTATFNDVGRRNNVHAEDSKAAHEDGNYVHYVENENILNMEGRLGSMDKGPMSANKSPCNTGPEEVNGDVGPTPGNNLGKRNRDERSLPSIGSVQGPAQRLFCHQDPNYVPLDLNTPARAVPKDQDQNKEELGADISDLDYHGPVLQEDNEDNGSRHGERNQVDGDPVYSISEEIAATVQGRLL